MDGSAGGSRGLLRLAAALLAVLCAALVLAVVWPGASRAQEAAPQEGAPDDPAVAAAADAANAEAVETAEEAKPIDKEAYTKDPATDPWNEHISVQVNGGGRFNMGARPDPATGGPKAGSYNMMYAWPSSPGTSYSTVRVDGQDFVYGGTGTVVEPPVDDNAAGTNRSSWMLPGGVKVTQTLTIVEGQGTGLKDTAEVRYDLENTSPSEHNVGLRVMNDVMLDNNDGALFRVPGLGNFTTEKEFVGDEVPDYFLSMRSFEDSEHVAAGTLVGGGAATPPDRFVVGTWPGLVGSVFDYAPSSGRSIAGDSAYAAYWTNRSLPAGEKLSFVHYYGASQVTSDLRPPLAVNMFAPSALSVTGDGKALAPNPFTVSADVRNVGGGAARNVRAIFSSYPEDLAVEGEGTVALGNLEPGQEKPVSYRVKVPPSSKERTYSIGVMVVADGVEPKTVFRTLRVPPTADPEARNYVAIGDSTTAGHSVRDCKLADEKKYYPYGCPVEPAPAGIGAAYPDLLQAMLGPPYSDGYKTAAEGDYKAAYEAHRHVPPNGALEFFPNYDNSTLGPQNERFSRVGVFGYTIAEAVADYANAKVNPYGEDRRYAGGDKEVPTPWESQLHAVEDAQELVTVSMGANDMNFSAYDEWILEEYNGTTQENADSYIEELKADNKLDTFFDVLDKASNRGVKVVVNKYYNGVHAPWFDGGGVPGAGPQPTRPVQPGMSPSVDVPVTPHCQTFYGAAETITSTINDALEEEVRSANANGGDMELADLPVKWVEGGLGDHGMGGPYPEESWVFGSKCNVPGALSSAAPDSDNGYNDLRQEIGEDYDPHPNLAGSTAMAEEMKKVIENE